MDGGQGGEGLRGDGALKGMFLGSKQPRSRPGWWGARR